MELRPERIRNARFPANASQVGFSFRKKMLGVCGFTCGNLESAVAREKVHMPLGDAASRNKLSFPRLYIGSDFRPGVRSRLRFEKGSAAKTGLGLSSSLLRGARDNVRRVCRRIRRHVGCNRLAPACPEGDQIASESYRRQITGECNELVTRGKVRSFRPYYRGTPRIPNSFNLMVIHRHQGPKTGGIGGSVDSRKPLRGPKNSARP